MAGRSTNEWIGKTPNTAIPPRVKLRVFLAHDGRCHLSKRKIGPADQWDCDHVIALINGGENRESNLAPALRDKHREKTAQDVAEKSKVARVRAKFLGVRPKSKGFGSSRFKKKLNGEVVERYPNGKL